MRTRIAQYVAVAVLGILLGLACCEVVERVTYIFASSLLDGSALEVVPREMDY